MAWPCGIGRRSSPFKQLLVFFVAVYLVGLLYFSMPTSTSQRPASLTDRASIDDIIKGEWKQGPGPIQYLPSSCRPQNNVVFIKCMKCATETIATVFRRFAYHNNLSVVLPVDKRIYHGWPFPITPVDYRPSSHGYNLLIEHAIYNGTFMRQLMNPGTVFVTIIREPLDQFVSSLNYFNVFQLANVPLKQGMEAVQTYLRNIQHYESVYKGHAAAPKRYCIPDGFSVTKNILSHCLGMPLGFPPGRPNITNDFAAVSQYIKNLDSEFLLVMLMEYFDESLVLLKRLLCWSIKDMVYHSINKGTYHKNMSWSILTEQDRQLHGAWSRVDYLLYNHFNRTFWRRVHTQGADFFQEVAFFREVQHQVSSFCHKVTPYGESHINFPESPWSPAFSFTAWDCRLMVSPLLVKLKDRYQKQEPQFANFSTTNITRKFVPLC